ncbi:MAG: Monogalactosyldiacylglycerol synthase [uncultured bacterium (gcode 4)]|uniref:Monogalactosyldiacylglycerol synthase n=1 Tax=uncultured bacterium (gcode 4) TaxID=1234023 RepID=K2GYW9_9BACT|nr:MAG: Monogalactosyldiacylglycerol synthase [uncultured bacterium (gcode 4)]
MKKYLILTASYWTWHNAAAGAIKKHLIQKWDGVEILDMTELLVKWWDNSKKFYSLSEKIPFIWDATFTLLDQQFTNEILNMIFKSIYQKKFNKFVDNYLPDYIICTFPNWPIFINNYLLTRKKYFKTAEIITDAIEIWMPWYFSSDIIDNFFVIDKNTKSIFKKKFKHHKNNVSVSFFPIEEQYFVNKESIQNKQIMILLTWLKPDFVTSLLQKLKDETFYDKVKIIKWRNDSVYNKVKQKMKDSRFEFIDFVNIKDTLKKVDIFIAKPGWAIMCECIAQDVPIIVPSFIPWQEEWNIKLLEKESLGFYEPNPEKIIFALKFVDFKRFLPNFKKVKKKNSIAYIIDKMARTD